MTTLLGNHPWRERLAEIISAPLGNRKIGWSDLWLAVGLRRQK